MDRRQLDPGADAHAHAAGTARRLRDFRDRRNLRSLEIPPEADDRPLHDRGFHSDRALGRVRSVAGRPASAR